MNSITVDGRSVSPEELTEMMSNPNIKLKKISENTYKTLQKLEGQGEPKILKLSTEEKFFIDTVSAIASRDKNTVKDILRALLIASTVHLYESIELDGKDECDLIIPYIGKIHLEYFEHNSDEGTGTKLKLSVIPSDALIEEVSCIVSGDTTPSENFIKRQIVKYIQSVVELEDCEIGIDD